MDERPAAPTSAAGAPPVPVPPRRPRLGPRLGQVSDGGWPGLLRRLVRFGTVGGVAYLVDVALFNVLLSFAGAPPLLAKVGSTAVATVIAWLGNRYWTFRHRRTARPGREFLVFAAACTCGLVVNLAVLGISHYVLGLTSVLADNVAGNVVGVLLGSAVRFWSYSVIVFPTAGTDAPNESEAPVPALALTDREPAGLDGAPRLGAASPRTGGSVHRSPTSLTLGSGEPPSVQP